MDDPDSDCGRLLSGALLKYIVPGARGSGIPQVKVAYAIRGGRVPLIDAIGKFVIGVLQIGTGSSLGREGPTVQICAGVSSALGRGAALSRDNLGLLTMSDIVRAHAEAAISASDPDKIVSPDFTEAAELLERSQP